MLVFRPIERWCLNWKCRFEPGSCCVCIPLPAFFPIASCHLSFNYKKTINHSCNGSFLPCCEVHLRKCGTLDLASICRLLIKWKQIWTQAWNIWVSLSDVLIKNKIYSMHLDSFSFLAYVKWKLFHGRASEIRTLNKRYVVCVSLLPKSPLVWLAC